MLGFSDVSYLGIMFFKNYPFNLHSSLLLCKPSKSGFLLELDFQSLIFPPLMYLCPTYIIGSIHVDCLDVGGGVTGRCAFLSNYCSEAELFNMALHERFASVFITDSLQAAV